MTELLLVYFLPTLFFCWLADGDRGLPLLGKILTSALIPFVCCGETALAAVTPNIIFIGPWDAFFQNGIAAFGRRFAAVLAAEILFWAVRFRMGRREITRRS